jgi:nucleoside-diphosphate-sugar epimerase
MPWLRGVNECSVWGVTALLTGVGYIGGVLLRRLLERGERVVALDNGYSTSLADIRALLPPEVTLIEGDVADPDPVARAFELGIGDDLVVYHLAAQPSAAMAEREPDLTERTNLRGGRIVLEMARRYGTPVVFGGSFRVYGDELAGLVVDERTPYGRVGDLSHLSKLYVEQLGRMLGVRFVSVRLGVTYGLAPIMKRVPAFMTVPNLFCQRAAEGEVLQVLQDRPLAFIHVEDAADALLLAGARVRAGECVWDVLNAAPEVAGIGELAQLVQRLAQAHGRWSRVQGVTPSAKHAHFAVRSKLEQHGFKARRSLADGLPDVFDYFVHRA